MVSRTDYRLTALHPRQSLNRPDWETRLSEANPNALASSACFSASRNRQGALVRVPGEMCITLDLGGSGHPECSMQRLIRLDAFCGLLRYFKFL